MKRLTVLGAVIGLAPLLAAPAQAQLSGSHALGDYGVQSGTQAPAGFYAALFYNRYTTDTIKDADGTTVRPFPDSPTSVDVDALAGLFWYVSKAKVLGAHYSALMSIPFADGVIEAPAFALTETIDTGYADMLVRPLDLGWHRKKADVDLGVQLYIPTGRYTQGASDNLGKGMWTLEPYVGTTLYFDEKRTLSLATTAFWETHTKKKDTETKVGQVLTLEGGFGKSFKGGGVVIGFAYYAQFKLTDDQLTEFELPGGEVINVDFPTKHHVWAFGPDVTLPIASKSKLFALVDIRYFWETDARVKTEGQNLVVTATFPVPSVNLK